MDRTRLMWGARLVAAAAAAMLFGVALSGGTAGAQSLYPNGKAPITWWVPGPDPTPGTLVKAAKDFTKKTGIAVNEQEFPWATYLQKTTAAITADTLPDVIEIGNTESPSLQQTGAFMTWTPKLYKTIGGKQQFNAQSLGTTGVPGKAPMSVPFLAQTWVLLYNKQLFSKAGISTPPTTWPDFVTDGKKLTNQAANQWGVSVDIGSPSAESTWTWILSSQYGGGLYTKNGKTDVTSTADAKAIDSYVQWVYPDQIVSPPVASDSTGTVAQTQFLAGQSGMWLTQDVEPAVQNPNEFGISVVPLPSPMPKGGQKIMSHVAGENLAISKSTKHLGEAEEFVKFLVGTSEQNTINQGMYELPVTHAALNTPYFQSASMKTFASVLSKYARPMPVYPNSATLENDLGNAAVSLVRTDISNKAITQSQVQSALNGVQQTVAASGS